MFPSKRKTPIRYENYRKRVLGPAAEACGIPDLIYPMLRRSFSTMAVDGGASVKDVQHQMRHTQANMSLYYAKSIPASVSQEVNRLSQRLGEKVDQKTQEEDGQEPFSPSPGPKAHHTHALPAKCSKELQTAPKIYRRNLLKVNGGRAGLEPRTSCV